MANLAFKYGDRDGSDGLEGDTPSRRMPLLLGCVAIGLVMFLVGRAFAHYVVVIAQ